MNFDDVPSLALVPFVPTLALVLSLRAAAAAAAARSENTTAPSSSRTPSRRNVKSNPTPAAIDGRRSGTAGGPKSCQSRPRRTTPRTSLRASFSARRIVSSRARSCRSPPRPRRIGSARTSGLRATPTARRRGSRRRLFPDEVPGGAVHHEPDVVRAAQDAPEHQGGDGRQEVAGDVRGRENRQGIPRPRRDGTGPPRRRRIGSADAERARRGAVRRAEAPRRIAPSTSTASRIPRRGNSPSSSSCDSRAPRVVRRGREEYSKMGAFCCVDEPRPASFIETRRGAGERRTCWRRGCVEATAPGPSRGSWRGSSRQERGAAPVHRARRRDGRRPRRAVSPRRPPSSSSSFGDSPHRRGAETRRARSDRLDTDINEAPDVRALMRVVLNEWDSLQPKHVADAPGVSRASRPGTATRNRAETSATPTLRPSSVASRRSPRRGWTSPPREGRHREPDIASRRDLRRGGVRRRRRERAREPGKPRVALDPTRVGSPGWRAWRAVLALPAAPNKAPYTPRNVMRLWYAMATAHDAAGDDVREAAVPDATWNARRRGA